MRHSKFGRPSGSGLKAAKLRVSKTSPVWTLIADMAWISGQAAKRGQEPTHAPPQNGYSITWSAIESMS